MKKTIFLVDDDIDVIAMYKAFLEKEGYNVLTAYDSKTGIEAMKSNKPDLAILDVMMTYHYEGFDMRQKMSSDPAFKDIPVVFTTSIDLLITTDGQKESIQAMAHEFRKDPKFKDLDVLLIKNLSNGLSGVDYRSEGGKNVYFEVDGFLRKPVKAEELIPEVKRILA
ncbi:MAG: response regulator [Bacteroidales bacterium]|nr:response regulator [Bacteroidales bacterium]